VLAFSLKEKLFIFVWNQFSRKFKDPLFGLLEVRILEMWDYYLREGMAKWVKQQLCELSEGRIEYSHGK
jgi:hypothetical protein